MGAALALIMVGRCAWWMPCEVTRWERRGKRARVEMHMTLHENAQPLAFLLGTWSGEGDGTYPTIPDFRYGEEISFTSTGRPFLVYAQRTWGLPDRNPLHVETGYWRVAGATHVEAMLAHPTGIVEVQEGPLSGQTLRLKSRLMGLSGTAKYVGTLHRTLEVRGEFLHYSVDMEAVGQPLTRHLTAVLKRVT